MPLRDYQERAIAQIRVATRSHRRILLVSPTGSGKTVILTEVIRAVVDKGKRALVVAHRKELIDQFYSALYRAGFRPGIMRGDDDRTDTSSPIQLGTIQTLSQRELPPADFVILDEAHRVPGESYARLVESYPRAVILGATATPTRLDGRPIGDHFDTMVIAATYEELFAWRGSDGERAIVEPIVYAPVPPDLSGVEKIAGEYHAGQLESAMRKPHVIGDVVKEWEDKADGRSTVVFASGISHADQLVGLFSDAGASVRAIYGSSNEPERTSALVDLELGKIQIVVNVDVLTEGWDQPRVKCVSMCRPTLSLTKHMQTAGRMLRPWGDKPPILLDHAGNCEMHGLPHWDRVWSLTGKVQRAKEPAVRICGKCFAYVETMPCPLCGYRTARKPRELRVAPGQLRVVEPRQKPATAPDDPKRLAFDALVREARAKGWKPFAVVMKFRNTYGYKPPWSLDVDDAWRAAVARREKQKEWQSGQGSRPAPAAADKVPRAKPAREKLPSRQTALSLGANDTSKP